MILLYSTVYVLLHTAVAFDRVRIIYSLLWVNILLFCYCSIIHSVCLLPFHRCLSSWEFSMVSIIYLPFWVNINVVLLQFYSTVCVSFILHTAVSFAWRGYGKVGTISFLCWININYCSVTILLHSMCVFPLFYTQLSHLMSNQQG